MRSPSLGERTVPYLVVSFGVLLMFAAVVEWVLVAELRADLVIGAITTFPFKGAIVFGGYWLLRSGVSSGRHLRIAVWIFAGVLVFFLMNVLLMVITPPPSLLYFFGWTRWAVTTGGAVGLLVGLTEARAIEREVSAEQAALRAEYTESQREWLDYLNSLLRHEVLNNANVISGYSSDLLDREDVPDPASHHLQVINRQSQEMANVVRDVRILLETIEDGPDFEATNLSDVLRNEIRNVRDLPEDIRIDAAIPDDVIVAADELLPRLFSNLLVNAVEHNESETPRVRVTVDTAPETVRVRIADEGPGIPDDQLDRLFQRNDDRRSDHGLGLYLVRRLVERYGGTIEVTETGPEGSVFTVELPRAEDGDDASSSTAAPASIAE